jgi:hypothetical protein
MAHHASGERRLMLAVLEDAVRNVALARNARISSKRARQELAWVTSVDRTDPFAFESICDALGIDPSWLRARLLRGALPERVTIRRTTQLAGPTRTCSASF